MEKTVYQGKFIKVTEEVIENNTWERVYLHDGIQVFPINNEGKIALIEEKRPHEKEKVRLKFVTGLMDKDNEDPILTANRELQEEIGYKAKHLQVLFTKESTGTVNNTFYQVIATGLEKSKIPNPDGEDTILSVQFYSIDEIENFLENDQLQWNLGALGILRIKKLFEKNLINYK